VVGQKDSQRIGMTNKLNKAAIALVTVCAIGSQQVLAAKWVEEDLNSFVEINDQEIQIHTAGNHEYGNHDHINALFDNTEWQKVGRVCLSVGRQGYPFNDDDCFTPSIIKTFSSANDAYRIISFGTEKYGLSEKIADFEAKLSSGQVMTVGWESPVWFGYYVSREQILTDEASSLMSKNPPELVNQVIPEDPAMNAIIAEIIQYYGPKNTALYADESVEQPQSVKDRWLDPESKPNWHKADRSDITFENFVASNYFATADPIFQNSNISCKWRSSSSINGVTNEILFSIDGTKWLDLNSHRDGSYSVTLWDWYNTVAIASGDETFISHGKPVLGRWNQKVPHSLIREMLETGRFELFIEPNPYRVDGMLWDREMKIESGMKAMTNLHVNVEIPQGSIDQDCINDFR
jgi:hypothetical protein